jgi:TolA-binding protein
MPRLALVFLVCLVGASLAADAPKDTSAASFTKNKKLKGKVTVEAKDVPLKDIIADISSQLEDLKLGPISVSYDTGLSGNTKTSLNVKDTPAEDALADVLKKLGLSFTVISKEKDRYDGWVRVSKGDAEPSTKPTETTKPKPTETKPTDPKKPVDTKPVEAKTLEPVVKPKPMEAEATPEEIAEDEAQALKRLDLAKKHIVEGEKADAQELLKYILKRYPNSKSAPEAKKLLDSK